MPITFENIPRWNYAIQRTVKTSPGPVGVGTTYRQTRTIPRPIEEELVITVYEPDRLLAIAAPLLSGQIKHAVAENILVLKDLLEK